MKALILTLLVLSSAQAIAKSEIERAMGFIANYASMGMHLKDIETQVAKLRAENEVKRANWLANLQVESHRAAKAGLIEYEEQTKTMITKHEAILERTSQMRTAAKESFTICITWQKKSAESRVTFENLIDDLKLHNEIDMQISDTLKDQCSRHLVPACLLMSRLSEVMEEREKQTSIAQKMHDQIEKSQIANICQLLSKDGINARQTESNIQTEIKRLNNLLVAIRTKLQGYK